MKATQQQFKISVEQEILYGKLLKESAIAMGQVGRLPEFKVYQATDKLNNQKAQAYQIIKNTGVINALQLADNGFPYDRVITSDKFLVKLGREVGDLVNLVLILNDELERIRKNSIDI